MGYQSYDHSMFNVKSLKGGQVNVDRVYIKCTVIITITSGIVYSGWTYSNSIKGSFKVKNSCNPMESL